MEAEARKDQTGEQMARQDLVGLWAELEVMGVTRVVLLVAPVVPEQMEIQADQVQMESTGPQELAGQ